MPDMFRAKCGNHRGLSCARGCPALALAIALVLDSSVADAASDTLWPLASEYFPAFARLKPHEIAALTLILGVLFFAVFATILLLRAYSRLASTRDAAHRQIAALTADIDQLNEFLLCEPRLLIAWAAGADEPDIFGDASHILPGSDPYLVLAFDAWLDAAQAHALAQAVERLRAAGESFSLSLATVYGRRIEAEGRAVAGRAVLRLREVSGVERACAELNARYQRLKTEAEAWRLLVEASPLPVAVRDTAGRLVFVNAAYARAVQAPDAQTALVRGTELLDQAAREELARQRRDDGAARARVPLIVGGERRTLDICAFPLPGGSAEIGIDATEVQRLRAELERLAQAHRRTLDQLSTAVAIFGADQRLAFYNRAYRSLWNLDATFLDQRPTDSAVLDRLRAARSLPEQQDFRQWKAQLHEAYRTGEARTHEWHLPDGRTLRVVTTPNPEGGVTYLFDDVTERLDLERRFDALISVQGETLDHLAEAVAVFGSDGRVRLFNPALVRLWKLDATFLSARPHIEAVIAACRRLHHDDATWQKLRAAVTALDQRDPLSLRIERNDGSVVDCTTVPLPDGGTLVTFQDVTDTVHVERALRERNEALIAANELKVGFVHHVSYELRSPLTNIIGFAHLLGDRATGPLNERQREYLSYITASTNALLALINNILDLASIDAGEMMLELGPVDIRKTMEAAAEGIQDRLVKDGISLDIRAAPDIGHFIADERRVRQVLFNLLSNAVGFSPAGETVTLSAERRPDAIVFRVTDRGRGIPSDMKGKVFDWFATHTSGSRHRGLGLGLSLVRSFVELHGGTVQIDSTLGRGTTVICTFPIRQAAARTAAE